MSSYSRFLEGIGQSPFKVAGDYMPFTGVNFDEVYKGPYGLDLFNSLTDEDKDNANDTSQGKETKGRTTGDAIFAASKDANELQRFLLSHEYQRQQAELADEIAGRQMARAQKYGERSAMLGFLYKGLPNMIKDMEMAKYAGAGASLAGIRDNLGRISVPQVTTGRYFQNMPV